MTSTWLPAALISTGDGAGETAGDGDGEADGEGLGESDGDGDGLGEGLELEEGEGLGEGVSSACTGEENNRATIMRRRGRNIGKYYGQPFNVTLR